MAKLPNVYILILSFNRRDDTLATLESIERLNVAGFKLTTLVVDNASKDDSVKALRNFKMSNGRFLLIANKTNLGFSEGNNVGLRRALGQGADFVMVLNDDTIVEANLICDLLAVFKKYPKAGILAPKIYFAKGYEYRSRYKKEDLGKVIWYAGGDIDWKNVYGTNHGVDAVDKAQFDKVSETGFATGCCLFVRRQVLKEVGLFDKRYFAYIEDADLSQRTKRAGWRVLYAPPARLWHKVSQSSGIGSELNDYFITRNRMIFGLAYAPLRTKVALIRESIRLLFNGRKWQKVGIRDFYLGRFEKGSWK